MTKAIILTRPPSEDFTPTTDLALFRSKENIAETVLAQRWESAFRSCWVVLPTVVCDKLQIAMPTENSGVLHGKPAIIQSGAA